MSYKNENQIFYNFMLLRSVKVNLLTYTTPIRTVAVRRSTGARNWHFGSFPNLDSERNCIFVPKIRLLINRSFVNLPEKVRVEGQVYRVSVELHPSIFIFHDPR